MALRCVISDFDGTLTDVDAHGSIYLAKYQEGLAKALSLPEDRLAPVWSRHLATILGNPTEHAFVLSGHAVAPSTADPYLLGHAIAHRCFADVAPDRSERERADIVQELYRSCYDTESPPFRAEAVDLLETAIDRCGQVFVVTNSDPTKVGKRLDELTGLRRRSQVTVQGNAQKFFIGEPTVPDARFSKIPEHLDVPGLPRPVLLRRGAYFNALLRVFNLAGAEPETTFVLGDIWELDLALPAQLGACTHLMDRPTTPKHERDAIGQDPRGSCSTSLVTAIERMKHL